VSWQQYPNPKHHQNIIEMVEQTDTTTATAAAGGAGAASAGGGAAAADPRDAYSAKEQHAVCIVESHMQEALERDVIMVATAAVERHKQLKDIARFIQKGISALHPGGNKVRGGWGFF